MKKSIEKLRDVVSVELYNRIIEKFGNKITPRKFHVISDIIKQNGEHSNTIDLIEEYFKLGSVSHRSVEIRYGLEEVEARKNKLKSRPPIDRSKQNVHCAEYISKVKGISIDEAKTRIALSNSKRSGSLKMAFMANPKKRDSNPLTIEYWIKRKGHSNPEEHRLNYIATKHNNSKDFYMRKYGSLDKFHERIEKRRETNIERYGTAVVSARVSKESIEFFGRLESKLIDRGLCSDDIVRGTSKTREYFINTKYGTFFVDFVIRSKKIAVEYNGVFWHPRADLEWRNPMVDEQVAILKDEIKEKAIIEHGFKLIKVWSDSDLELEINKIVELCTVEMKTNE